MPSSCSPVQLQRGTGSRHDPARRCGLDRKKRHDINVLRIAPAPKVRRRCDRCAKKAHTRSRPARPRKGKHRVGGTPASARRRISSRRLGKLPGALTSRSNAAGRSGADFRAREGSATCLSGRADPAVRFAPSPISADTVIASAALGHWVGFRAKHPGRP